MVFILTITLVAVLAVLYGGVCAFYWRFQERFVFVRFRLRRDFVFPFGQPHTEVFLEPSPGVTLHALHFQVEAPRGTVLYFHGNTGSLRRWGKQAGRFVRMGFNVLMMDYRGFGKSRGPITEKALHQDADTWYQWLAQRVPEQDIVVYGRSLGSGMAVPVAAEHRPRLLVLETPFADLMDAARHQFGVLPYRWLLRYRFRNDKAIKRVKCPVYIFHGKQDPVVPYASALRLYSLVPTDVRREMVSFAKGFHSDLAKYARFHRKMREFLGVPAQGRT